MSETDDTDDSCRNDDDESLFAILPPDLVLYIFDRCSIQSLGRLSRTCKRFKATIDHNSAWRYRSQDVLVTSRRNRIHDGRQSFFWYLTCKEMCRISRNWTGGCFSEHEYLISKERYLPWLWMDDQFVWMSRGKEIKVFNRREARFEPSLTRKLLHCGDVCRFVKGDNVMVSGHMEGAIVVQSMNHIESKTFNKAHNSHVNAVDISETNHIVVSGGEDKILKVWRVDVDRPELSTETPIHSYKVLDNIISLAQIPDGAHMCCVGMSAVQSVPLLVYNIDNQTVVHSLKADERKGAGALDVQWYSPHIVISAGYDTAVRMWDLRCGKNINSWIDPFDSSVYCFQSDKDYAIVSGYSTHGRLMLWDIRKATPVQMFYACRSASDSTPIYSLRFDEGHLFAGLDRSFNFYDFSSRNSVSRSYNVT